MAYADYNDVLNITETLISGRFLATLMSIILMISIVSLLL